MATLKLDPAPTFDATVGIPVAGGDPAPVVFTFKHRSREAFLEWLGTLDGKELYDSGVVLEMASGWNLDDSFNEASVKKLLSNFMGASRAIFNTYNEELTATKLKN